MTKQINFTEVNPISKKQHDKRATVKDRDWKRDQARLMRDRG